MSHRFYIVDVFAERPYAGNQLAVVIGADDLTDETMQEVAAETNYSETTFVMSAREHDHGYRVRIFTPAREIAFAGHPILGTAWVVRHHVAPDASGPVRLRLDVGEVPVTFEKSPDGGDVAWFLAPPVIPGVLCARDRIAAAVGVAPEDIETKAPVQRYSAGSTSAIMVPLRSLDALQRSQLDLQAFAPLAAEGWPPLTYLFCRQTHHSENDLCARFFFDAHGVREDPATGNGAAFLDRAGRTPLMQCPSPAQSIVQLVVPDEGLPMIRKLPSGEYRLYSRKTDPKTGKRRNLGTFKTREAAEKHERAVQYFKRRG